MGSCYFYYYYYYNYASHGNVDDTAKIFWDLDVTGWGHPFSTCYGLRIFIDKLLERQCIAVC